MRLDGISGVNVFSLTLFAWAAQFTDQPCLFILFYLLTGTLPIKFLSLMFFYPTLPLHIGSALLFSAGPFASSRTGCEVGWWRTQSCELGTPAVYFGGTLDCHWVPPVCLGRFVIFRVVRLESTPTSNTVLTFASFHIHPEQNKLSGYSLWSWQDHTFSLHCLLIYFERFQCFSVSKKSLPAK